MKRLLLIAQLAALLFLRGCTPDFSTHAFAQNSPPPAPQGKTYTASQYGQWLLYVNQGNASTGAQTIYVNGYNSNGPNIPPFVPGLPIRFPSETVNIGSVQICNSGVNNCVTSQVCNPGSQLCAVNGTFTQAHARLDTIQSGTYGLQEAINVAMTSGTGGTILVDQTWGGQTAMITAAVGSTAVVIQDNRSGVPINYQWNGSAYVAASTGGAVSSVFGRAGAVIAASGDYTCPQITGCGVAALPLGYSPVIYSFGDSITEGFPLISQAAAYPFQVARYLAGVVYDFGVFGATSNSIDSVIFANTIGVNAPTGTTLITEQIGTNNVNSGASTPAETNYGVNVEAQYAWLALLPARKFTFQGEGPTFPGGTWTNNSDGVGKNCTGTACSSTFTGTGTILYLITSAQNANTAAATLTCDGSATGTTLNFAPISGFTFVTVTTSTMFSRTTLSAGAHSCTVQSTSSTGTVNLEWGAFLSGSALTDGPYLLAANVPNANPVNAVAAAYSAVQQAAVTQLVGDGLTKVLQVNAASVNTTAAFFTGLTVHPNEPGHLALASTYLSALGTALGKTINVGTYYGAPIQNLAYGSNFIISTLLANPFALTGSNNTADGFQSGSTLTSGGNNSFFGQDAGFDTSTGSSNSFVGSFAGQLNTVGSNNTYSGSQSGTSITGSSANNVISGALAGLAVQANVGTPSISTLNDSVYVGYQSTPQTNNLTNSNAFGDKSACTLSNSLCLGSPAVTTTTIEGVTSAPAINSPLIQTSTLPTPTLVTVSNVGTPGSTSYTYAVVARNGSGGTAAVSIGSNTVVFTTGQAVLVNPTAENAVLLPPFLNGVQCYDVYRTASGGTGTSGTTGKIASCISNYVYFDAGTSGDSTSPPTNATGGFVSNNSGSTTVVGSIGHINFGQTDIGGSFKRVVIFFSNETGAASFTFPVAFFATPLIVVGATGGAATVPASTVTSLSTTAVTVTGSANTGFIILEGW